ncbi:MAG: conjugal transfer protein TrbC [Rhodospirillales bacterium]|nr:MAG: conjugal transfer protein TrbC [Rhodospirillales bacterium]
MNQGLKSITAAAALSLLAATAQAAGTGMPWESTLDSVLNSLTGPVLRALIILAIVAAGIGLAFTEGGTMLRRSIAAVFGLSIAAAAVSWGLGFFGFAGGAVF